MTALGVKDKTGALFFASMNQTMMGMFGTLLTFEAERFVFLREQGDKSYGVIPYFLSKTFVEVPFQILNAIFFTLLTYFAVGYNAEITHFLFYSMTLSLLVVCAGSFGFLFSAAFGAEA